LWSIPCRTDRSRWSGADYVSWDGDDRIKLEVTLWTVDGGGNHALVKQSAELERTSSGWVLNKNVPSGQQ
jgi:hypothetical protein